MENDKLVRLSDVQNTILSYGIGWGDAKVKGVLTSIPAVDAVEVRHSVWTMRRTWEHDGEPYCKKCGYAPYDRRDCGKFCGNCGARMDGEEAHNALD